MKIDENKSKQNTSNPLLNLKHMRKIKGKKKTQNQVEKSAKLKTHTCDLKILSYKYATMEIGDGNTECLGGR